NATDSLRMRSTSSKASTPSWSRITSPRIRPSRRMSSIRGRSLSLARREGDWAFGRMVGFSQLRTELKVCPASLSIACMLASSLPPNYQQVTTLSKLVIATRESRLAMWQAEHVKALLEQRGHQVSLLGMTTRGDQILDRSLSKVGGKGLFVKELEVALEEGHADLAVH